MSKSICEQCYLRCYNKGERHPSLDHIPSWCPCPYAIYEETAKQTEELHKRYKDNIPGSREDDH